MRLGLLSEDSRILKAFLYNPPPEPVMRKFINSYRISLN